MNVVFFKLVLMSFEWNLFYYFLFYVVDDLVLNILNGVKCVCIQNDFILWMVIDLENIFNVNYIILFNRIDILGNIFLIYSKVLFVLIYFGVCFFNLWYRMVFRYYMIGYVCENESESDCIFGLKIKYLFLC